jgi:CRP-like cAMP-binding protein
MKPALMSLTRDKKLPTAGAHVRPLLARFIDLPAREWRHLEGHLCFRSLAAGEALTRAGDVAQQVGFVVDGLIRKVHVSARGKSVVRGFGGPGSIVGAYASLLTQQPSYLRVEALRPTRLFVAEWSLVLELYERHPCWQVLGRKLAEHFLLEREERAHELLTLGPSERYARFCATHRALLPMLRAYDVASYLGITPVSLSRLRARERRQRALRAASAP